MRPFVVCHGIRGRIECRMPGIRLQNGVQNDEYVCPVRDKMLIENANLVSIPLFRRDKIGYRLNVGEERNAECRIP